MSGHAMTERIQYGFVTPHVLVRWVEKHATTGTLTLDLATGHFTAAAKSWDGIHRLVTLHALAQEERALWLAELSRENPPTIPSPENR